MRDYLDSRLVRLGLVLLVLGTGPLAFIVVAAAVGLWPDPHPNPVGPGLLSLFTFWPAVVSMVAGVIRVRIRRRPQDLPRDPGERRAPTEKPP